MAENYVLQFDTKNVLQSGVNESNSVLEMGISYRKNSVILLQMDNG